MRRPVVLNIEPHGCPAEARRVLAGVGELREVSMGRDEIIRSLTDVDVLVLRFGQRVDEPLLVNASRLRLIGCPATGTDHIDERAIAERGIEVVSLKGDVVFLRSVTATAELTFGLILTLARHLHEAAAHVRAGGWDRDAFQGMQLSGKTLGIVGYGRLGRMVARYGRAFGMEVLASDPVAPPPEDEIEMLPLHALLARSDVVSLHVPLSDATRSLLDAAAINALRPGAFVINTSRGEVVDEAALLAGLDEGRIGGIAADVLAGEGWQPRDWPIDNPLWRRARHDTRIVITPHIGGKTVDSNQAAEIHLADKLAARMRAVYADRDSEPLK